MRKLFIFFFLLSPLTVSHSFCQVDREIQSAVESLISQRKFETALTLIDSLIEANSEASLSQANGYLLKAVILQSQKKLTEAYLLADSLLQAGIFEDSHELQMMTFLILGNVNYSRFRQKEATEIYLKIDSLGDQHQDGVNTQIKALTNLGTLMLSVEDGRVDDFLRSGDFYYLKALQLAIESKDSTAYFDVSTYVATQDFGKGKLDSIETIYLNAIRFFEKKNNTKLLSSTLWGLGWAYESEGELEKAAATYLRIITLNSTEPQNINGLARAHWIYANFLNRQDNLEGAIREFEIAQKLFLSEEEQDIGPLNGTIYNLATLYRKAGRDREAYEFLEKAWVMQDSIDRAMEYDQLKELEIKYQASQKDKALAELKLKSQKRNFQWAVGFAFLFVILAGFAFYIFYQRKKVALAKKITELDQVKNQFFENITHEFRTPLTLIDSPLQLLEKDNQISSEANSKLSLIRRQSDRLLELVDQILSLNQLKNSEINVLLKKGNLHQMISSLLEPFEFEAKEKEIRYKSQLNFTENQDWFDQDLIQKIISNLLGNALKYTPTGGEIQILVSTNRHRMRLQVLNSAADLQSQDLKRIFDRFYQKDASKSGFGIGLSLVKALVFRLNGSIEATKKEDYLQISVMIPLERELLPGNAIVLVEEPENHENSPAQIQVLEEKPIVLIAEDHPDTRSILAELFKNDYQILIASTGAEAWKICQEVIPDLILSDISMPDMGGLELCRRVKTHEFLSHVPVFLLTASSTILTQIAGSEVEADGYMTKPFNHQLLENEIKKLIGQRKKLRGRYSKEVILKPVDLAINSVEEQFLEKLQEVVTENFGKHDFGAEDFALEMEMSRMQLHRKLKHLTGLSAMEFLKDQRLKTAANLLKRNDLSVSDVAYSVGFNDLSHFSKSFKAKFGISPSDFQEQK
jgi:signal transduction histidine kinase/AraC-like DNA-binding protein